MINNVSIKKHFQWAQQGGEVGSLQDRFQGPGWLMNKATLELGYRTEPGESHPPHPHSHLPVRLAGRKHWCMAGTLVCLDGSIRESLFQEVSHNKFPFFQPLLPARPCVKCLTYSISFNTQKKTQSQYSHPIFLQRRNWNSEKFGDVAKDTHLLRGGVRIWTWVYQSLGPLHLATATDCFHHRLSHPDLLHEGMNSENVVNVHWATPGNVSQEWKKQENLSESATWVMLSL